MEPIKLHKPHERAFTSSERILRDGVELQKGVVLTEEWLKDHADFLNETFCLWSAYPDVMLQMILPEGSNFHLYPYQAIFLRAAMRYTRVYFTAVRAASKSFLSILAKFIQCMLIPNHVGSIVAPAKSQAVTVARQKLNEILRIWPLLANELEVYAGEPHIVAGKDYLTAFFKNGSTLSVGGQINSDRGKRTHSVFLDEARDLDGDMIQEVILPQMNVPRRTALGQVNPAEHINTQIIYGTSAGAKSSFAYEALIDIFEKSVINPNYAFTMGIDYRIPVKHGLISKEHINDLKMSPSYNEQTFAAEMCGLWSGGSDESWFQYEKLSKYRTLKNPDWQQKFKENPNVFYILSVDVGKKFADYISNNIIKSC